MKKIKFVMYENFPFGGASANFIRYITLGLSSEGYEIDVVLPKGNIYGANVENPNQRKGSVGNVKYKHLCFTNQPNAIFGKIISNLCAFLFPLFYLVKEYFAKNYDIIILYNPSFSKIISLLLIKKLFNKKFIIIIPEFFEKPSKQGLLASIVWYDFFLGMKFLVKYADAFIVVSTYLKKYIQDDLKVIKPIMVLPNLMDPEVFDIKDVKPFMEGVVTIGYTGTPTRKDGATDLIESFALLHKKCAHTHLLIVGDVTGGRSVIPELKRQAEELQIINNITFTGLVPFTKIPELLNSCQILALTRPSGVFAEAGFPTKLGEYFACKKPVLMTRVGDISTYFNNEEQLLIVNPDDIVDIANGFKKIIDSPQLSANMVENAFIWMKENLNYRTVNKNIAVFIENV